MVWRVVLHQGAHHAFVCTALWGSAARTAARSLLLAESTKKRAEDSAPPLEPQRRPAGPLQGPAEASKASPRDGPRVPFGSIIVRRRPSSSSSVVVVHRRRPSSPRRRRPSSSSPSSSSSKSRHTPASRACGYGATTTAGRPMNAALTASGVSGGDVLRCPCWLWLLRGTARCLWRGGSPRGDAAPRSENWDFARRWPKWSDFRCGRGETATATATATRMATTTRTTTTSSTAPCCLSLDHIFHGTARGSRWAGLRSLRFR